MNDASSLAAAWLAEPWNDDRRLVLADALADRGEDDTIIRRPGTLMIVRDLATDQGRDFCAAWATRGDSVRVGPVNWRPIPNGCGARCVYCESSRAEMTLVGGHWICQRRQCVVAATATVADVLVNAARPDLAVKCPCCRSWTIDLVGDGSCLACYHEGFRFTDQVQNPTRTGAYRTGRPRWIRTGPIGGIF